MRSMQDESLASGSEPTQEHSLVDRNFHTIDEGERRDTLPFRFQDYPDMEHVLKVQR